MKNTLLLFLLSFWGYNALSQCELNTFTSTHDDVIYNAAKVEAFNVKNLPKLTLNASKTNSNIDTNYQYTLGIAYIIESADIVNEGMSVELTLSDKSNLELFLENDVAGIFLSSSKYGSLYSLQLNLSISEADIERIYRFGIIELSCPTPGKSIRFSPKESRMNKFQKQLQCLYNEGFNSEKSK